MKECTIVIINWQQKNAVLLLLKSFLRFHHIGHPYKLILFDNHSLDGSVECFSENGIPHISSGTNSGHEGAINIIYPYIKTKYCLLLDSDIEFTGSVFEYFNQLLGYTISAGELIDKQYYEQTKINDRIAPWFWLWDIKRMKDCGVDTFRTKEDWQYDVGSEYWERMRSLGFKNYNIERLPGNQDADLISMRYERFNHAGKLSWDIFEKHQDRIDEVVKRRAYVDEQLKQYSDICLKGKFISGIK